ncbi:MAG: AsmA-like C-terminal region-containing protein [Opitutaceae bacterium]|nr:AsmA-like C-terminal region-containing protein [Opitutaceae bacterium]
MAWHGSCLVCKAAFDFVYTISVALLAGLVCVFAYIVTLDESSMPDFLIRMLERKLQTEGVSLSMSGIRLQPSGRITIDDPVIYSDTLQSEIARADLISIKLNPALLLFGQIRMSELDVLNGSLTAPALISPSGLSEPLVDQIDVRVENQPKGWEIKRSKFRFAKTRVIARGIIDIEDLPFEQMPKESHLSFNETLTAFYKNAQKVKIALAPINGLEARIQIHAPKGDPKSLHAQLSIEKAHWKNQANAENISIVFDAWHGQYTRLETDIAKATGPQNAFAENLHLETIWETFPSPEEWLPEYVRLTADSIGMDVEILSHLAVETKPLKNGDWVSRATLALQNSPWQIDVTGNPKTKTASVALAGTPTKDLITFASETALVYALQYAPQFQEKLEQWPIESFADITDEVTVQATAKFDGAWMPQIVDAFVETGRVASRGAHFDRAIARAQLRGKDLNVSNLWLRSGLQNGWMSIGVNLETLRRRILIDGLFNPNLINDWIPKDWWTEFWGNFKFPEAGFYCIMDSSQIIKQPETLKITGYGLGQDLIIRGHLMKEVETHMYILQRYFDLYNLNLIREEGDANGEAQVSIAPDPRDGKFKMSGLWIDAETNLDLSIGPDLISEVRQGVVEILEPYGYETPPHVKAKASSIRNLDLYDYAIDLQIDTDHPFSYYHYPLESVSATVKLGNGWASLPNITAKLAGGTARARAEIVDENIELGITLDDAHFGNTLKASAIYFRENDEDSSASSFSIEELSSYGGGLNLSFEGKGIVGDTLSYNGQGSYQISGADFYQLQLFGGLSRVLEGASLSFTTLKFEDAKGDFSVEKRYVEFPEVTLKGPVAQIASRGNYDLEEGDLDFKARLFPLRSMPFFNIPGLVLDLFTGIFEVSLTGTIADPKWSLFRTTKQREEETPPETQTVTQ